MPIKRKYNIWEDTKPTENIEPLKLMTKGSSINQTDLQRSANYRPNIWRDDFLQSLSSKYDKEEYAMQLNKCVIEVKCIFVQELDVMQKSELVDWIQKLGLANHFEKEIDDFLQTIFLSAQNFNKFSVQQNLHVSTLCFRLLRQHGYNIFPAVISHCNNYDQCHNKYIDRNNKNLYVTVIVFKKPDHNNKTNLNGYLLSNLLDGRDNSFARDAEDIIELLEATHLSLDGEKVLDDAKKFAINWVKDAVNNKERIPKNVIERVAHALELPSHLGVPWFDVKWTPLYLNYPN